jgi:hypothetical protein
MELTAVRVSTSPRDGRRVRLQGDVLYDDRPGAAPETYWFDVPEEHAGSLSQTGNPWLACLLPLAVRLGQPLRLCLPVDRLLYRNTRELMAMWSIWYPDVRPVEVVADCLTDPPPARGERSAAFFSTGVDSFFTTLRSADPGAIPIDDLISVWGFDMPYDQAGAVAKRGQRLASIARELGKTLVDVATNLRSTRLRQTSWGYLLHGGALASVGLALEGRYGTLLVAGPYDYGHVVPWGTHPQTDGLLSTSGTEVLHDGATYDRFEKVEYIARFEIALKNLHVCYRQTSDVNCGACEKCLRTMSMLEVLGKLEACGTFPRNASVSERLSRVYVANARGESHYRRIRREALARGRGDIARAARVTLRRSPRIRRLMTIPDWLDTRKGLWRAAAPIRRALLTGRLV